MKFKIPQICLGAVAILTTAFGVTALGQLLNRNEKKNKER